MLTEKRFVFRFFVEGNEMERSLLRVIVASSLEKIENGVGDVWESDCFFSDEKNVVYAPSECFCSDTDYLGTVSANGVRTQAARFGIGLKKAEWTVCWGIGKKFRRLHPYFFLPFP